MGHYIWTLGNTGLKYVETEVLLHEHNILCDNPPVSVFVCFPPNNYEITGEGNKDMKKNVNIEQITVLSTNPPG